MKNKTQETPQKKKKKKKESKKRKKKKRITLKIKKKREQEKWPILALPDGQIPDKCPEWDFVDC